MTDPLFDITGKRIVVVGAASGLGTAIARALAERGARLVLADANRDALTRIEAQWKGDAVFLGCDVTDEASVEALLDATVQRLGGLDWVVNTAGIFRIGPAVELAVADFRASLDVNVTGAFLLSRAAAKRMQPGGGGRIVHLASVSSKVANANYAAYASSKAALSHLVRVFAREWAEHAITVNAIGPAMMSETGMALPHLVDDDFKRNALSVIPMGRLGRPEDIVATTVLLLAAGGQFITGQTIYVDGGRTLM